jgi:hypothetical protein
MQATVHEKTSNIRWHVSAGTNAERPRQFRLGSSHEVTPSRAGKLMLHPMMQRIGRSAIAVY